MPVVKLKKHCNQNPIRLNIQVFYHLYFVQVDLESGTDFIFSSTKHRTFSAATVLVRKKTPRKRSHCRAHTYTPAE